MRKGLGIGDMLTNLITDLVMAVFDGLFRGLLK